MNTLNLNEIINSMVIENINPNTNFWMIRTNGGVFYNEFIENEFVALGWNIVDKKVIKEIEKDKAKDLKIKAEIEYTYRSKQSTHVLNKCKRFVNEVKNGDIFMIPSKSNEEITFATAEDYFEEENLDYAKEAEFNYQTAMVDGVEFKIKCPYKKRRKIKIIKQVKGNKLNPNLYRALTSRHGLSGINGYAHYILSSIYNMYYWENKLNVVFRVEQENDIDAIELSSFIYNSSSIIKCFDENVNISAKANLNSPGDIILSVQNYANQVVNDLVSFKSLIGLGAIWMMFFGGKFGPIEVKSLAEIIIKYKETNSKLETEELDRELKRIQISKQQIELEDEIQKHLEKIETSSNSLQINKDDAFKVISLVNYHHQKDGE